MPWLKKVELIEGVVYVASPVGIPHGSADSRVNGWRAFYVAQTPNTDSAINTTVRLGLENEVQPDTFLRIVNGGQTKVGPKDYLEGAPELVVEIASSSVSRDLHDK